MFYFINWASDPCFTEGTIHIMTVKFFNLFWYLKYFISNTIHIFSYLQYFVQIWMYKFNKLLVHRKITCLWSLACFLSTNMNVSDNKLELTRMKKLNSLKFFLTVSIRRCSGMKSFPITYLLWLWGIMQYGQYFE